jgi:hypothetical protein
MCGIEVRCEGIDGALAAELDNNGALIRQSLLCSDTE